MCFKELLPKNLQVSIVVVSGKISELLRKAIPENSRRELHLLSLVHLFSYNLEKNTAKHVF